VERWQGERFEFVRRMGQIFVAIQFGVSHFCFLVVFNQMHLHEGFFVLFGNRYRYRYRLIMFRAGTIIQTLTLVNAEQ